MTTDRRHLLHALAALPTALLLPSAARAQAGGTLAAVKQRGALRVGVTQAPPWYSKDPKSGEWSQAWASRWARPWPASWA
jgi:polar amino acid transport system substrate-binding protein